MSAQLLGVSYALTVNNADPALYENAPSGVSIRIPAQPMADLNVLEFMNALVNRPAAGINDALYSCAETTAGSSVFENERHGIVASLTSLDPGAVDTLSAKFYEANFATAVIPLTETSPASQIFTGQGFTAHLVNGSTFNGPIFIAVTSPGPALSNTVLRLDGSAGAFRNFDPNISTDGNPNTPEGAAFRIQTLARLGGPANTPAMRIRIKPSIGGGAPGPWTEVPMAETATPGVFESTDKLLLASDGSPPVPGI